MIRISFQFGRTPKVVLDSDAIARSFFLIVSELVELLSRFWELSIFEES